MLEEHGEPGASDEPDVSATPDAALDALLLHSGTPVHGADGTRLGTLSRDGFQDGRLFMHRVIGGPEIALPEAAIVRHDATGVYTAITWRELDAVSSPPPGSEMGMLDAFATGAEAAHANRFDETDIPE
ncbi:MAG: hypothetical protein ACXWQR_08740 [Ktedonobacterales bacterium]